MKVRQSKKGTAYDVKLDDYYSDGNHEDNLSTDRVRRIGETVIIPSGVKELGNREFANWTITTIIIPPSIQKIGDRAFAGCSLLTKLVALHVRVLPDAMCENCPKLLSVELPLVEEIGDEAFAYGEGLEAFTFPPRLRKLGRNSFLCCKTLLHVDLASTSVRSIPFAAFFDCKDLQTLVLPQNLVEISDRAFGRCHNLTSVTLPATLQRIGSSAFDGCSRMTSMIVPESVNSIGICAFRGCKNLCTLIVFCPPPQLPPAVLTVESRAFEGCSGLKIVSVPEQVVAVLGAPYAACATLAALPAAVTCNAFKLQIKTYYWSMKLHRNTNQLSTRQRAWVKHLLTVGSRARLYWGPVDNGPKSEPCFPAPKDPPLPCIPNDVWLLVLRFVKLSEMCSTQ